MSGMLHKVGPTAHPYLYYCRDQRGLLLVCRPPTATCVADCVVMNLYAFVGSNSYRGRNLLRPLREDRPTVIEFRSTLRAASVWHSVVAERNFANETQDAHGAERQNDRG